MATQSRLFTVANNRKKLKKHFFIPRYVLSTDRVLLFIVQGIFLSWVLLLSTFYACENSGWQVAEPGLGNRVQLASQAISDPPTVSFSWRSQTHWLRDHLFIFISQCFPTGRVYSSQMALLTSTKIYFMFLVAVIFLCHSPQYLLFHSLNNFFLSSIFFPEHAQPGCLLSQDPWPLLLLYWFYCDHLLQCICNLDYVCPFQKDFKAFMVS